MTADPSQDSLPADESAPTLPGSPADNDPAAAAILFDGGQVSKFVLRGGRVFLFSFKRRCPDCGSRDIHRSKRRGITEKLILPLVITRPFRCGECDSRYFGLFFAVRVKEKKTEEQPQAIQPHPEEAARS